MKLFTICLTVFLLLALTGCSSRKPSAKPCDLSGLAIKSIDLQGEKGDYVASAIARRLYARGAKQDFAAGAIFLGKTVWKPKEDLLAVSLLSLQASYASAQHVNVRFFDKDMSDDLMLMRTVGKLADAVADDFCACASRQKARTGDKPTTKTQPRAGRQPQN